jgi:hypothetical protein
MLKFDIEPWELDTVKSELDWTLKWNEGELLKDVTKENFVARFNLARLVFLERGL